MNPRPRRPPPTRRGGRSAEARRPRQPDGGLGGEHVEGRQAVAELLAAGRRRVYEVWMAAATDDAPVLGEITALAERRRVPVVRVARARLDSAARTDAPQGVLARAAPLPEADSDDLCRGGGRAGDPVPFLLALDGVTDPRNLGALLRSADAAGATGAVIPRHRAVGVTPAAAKAAAGAIEWLPIAPVAGIPSALARARDAGCWVIGLAGEAEESLFDLSLAEEPVVVVVGAEGPGLSRLTRQRCDVLVHIPMRGALSSLNAAAAGTLALFEVSRRRPFRHDRPARGRPRLR